MRPSYQEAAACTWQERIKLVHTRAQKVQFRSWEGPGPCCPETCDSGAERSEGTQVSLVPLRAYCSEGSGGSLVGRGPEFPRRAPLGESCCPQKNTS